MPAGYGFGFIFRFTKDLTLENKNGIAAKNGINITITISRKLQSLMHRSGLGGGQAKHQFSRIGIRNRALINAADSHPMGNTGLFEQPVSGLRRRSKQQQGGTQQLGMLLRLTPLGRSAIADPIVLLSNRSRNRAARAMRCLPFTDALYRDLQDQGLDAETLWHDQPRYRRGKGWRHNSENLEDDLRWLIRVGVLRREVDGQGLTSRFRLTPLGRQLLDGDPDLLQQRAAPLERLRHAVRRRWPL